jgi:hypothetical protein
MPPPQFGQLQQVHYRELQGAQDAVGDLRGQRPGSFEKVVHVGLRNACPPRQPALCEQAVADASP